MDILFKRTQTPIRWSGVIFKLWVKIELTEDEQALLKHYRFDGAILIRVYQPGLFKRAIGFGVFVFVLACALLILGVDALDATLSNKDAQITAGICAVIGAFWHYHNKRETIYVRDLLHGRYFYCHTVVDLVKQEARLNHMAAYFRQVMESAKHWDDTERQTIEPLSKEDARQVILKGP